VPRGARLFVGVDGPISLVSSVFRFFSFLGGVDAGDADFFVLVVFGIVFIVLDLQNCEVNGT
jgi:hypothetical protein